MTSPPESEEADALVRAWELPMHEQFRPVGYAREQLVSAIAAALAEARASAEGKARAEERERCARVADRIEHFGAECTAEGAAYSEGFDEAKARIAGRIRALKETP